MKKFAVLIVSIIMVMSFQTAAFAVASPGHSSNGGSGGGGSSSRKDRDTAASVTVVVDNPVQPSESTAEIALTDRELMEGANDPAAPQAADGNGYGIYHVLEGGEAAGVRSPKTGESAAMMYACLASLMCFGAAYQAKKHI